MVKIIVAIAVYTKCVIPATTNPHLTGLSSLKPTTINATEIIVNSMDPTMVVHLIGLQETHPRCVSTQHSHIVPFERAYPQPPIMEQNDQVRPTALPPIKQHPQIPTKAIPTMRSDI